MNKVVKKHTTVKCFDNHCHTKYMKVCKVVTSRAATIRFVAQLKTTPFVTHLLSAN